MKKENAKKGRGNAVCLGRGLGLRTVAVIFVGVSWLSNRFLIVGWEQE
jgi:hypothetical protein